MYILLICFGLPTIAIWLCELFKSHRWDLQRSPAQPGCSSTIRCLFANVQRVLHAYMIIDAHENVLNVLRIFVEVMQKLSVFQGNLKHDRCKGAQRGVSVVLSNCP